ncbi:DGQHR domain-containing protein [Saccharicrinis sp. 156]|uniref:DGQHR domain-containing protein n=1 Tax=Saccharicrinis sp. 156 TaxID=3417574 RepID=UPI003D325A22
MDSRQNNMYKFQVLEVKQPFGIFYITKINAYDLLQIVETDPYRVDSTGNHTGIQRAVDEKRLSVIAEYLKGVESSMPNSIIIGGNIIDDEKLRWEIKVEGDNKYINAPMEVKNGVIIDGQHRLKAFEHVSVEKQKEYELLCSIYLDLPNPYQAYIFATINMNQKTVDKSLAYDLYGYNLDEEKDESWSPEKVAVYLSRTLNFDKDSVFYNHITTAAENDDVLFETLPKYQKWNISTASIVRGILTLISSNPQRDRDALQQKTTKERNRSVLSDEKDSTPLRQYYLLNNDKLIYTIVANFFKAAHDCLYKDGSYIFKTIGIQSLFSLLKKVLIEKLEKDKDISTSYYKSILEKCKDIDFSDNFFTASGIGKTRITNTLLIKNGFMEIGSIRKEEDIPEYNRLLQINN